MTEALILPHGSVELPAFFPDGTYGAVRCVDASDLEACGVPGLVMNGFHLMTKPGVGVVRSLGGLHAFSGWRRPIITDSGGFQVFSLIRENPKYGEVRAKELVFRPEPGGARMTLTPEKSVQNQFAYGSDVIMCLDCCTHPSDTEEANERAVDITVSWAQRCKAEYERQLAARRLAGDARPRIFGIMQGGSFPELRKRCADELVRIGFDGYGFGGWPVDDSGALVEDTLRLVASLMPDEKPKYAMGIGQPDGLALCHAMGYNLFDCVAPTREARHNRLYVFAREGAGESGNSNAGCVGRDGARASERGLVPAWGKYYMLDDAHIRDDRPVSDVCDCLLCSRYSRAYLRHLCKTGDSQAQRLATMHNLRFYSMFMDRLRTRRR